MVYQTDKELPKFQIKAFTSGAMSMAGLMGKENLPMPTVLHTQAIGLMVFVMVKARQRNPMATLSMKAHSSME